MAHIALICNSFHPQVQILAKALSHQRHQVTLITHKSQEIPADFDGVVLRPFQNNSLWEAARLIPRLISQLPEIWHFVFCENEEDPTPAHWMLAQFARSIPHKIVVATFFSQLQEKQRWKLAAFLKNCDLITTGQRESLMYIKRQYKTRPSVLLDIVPPMDTIATSPSTTDEEIVRLSQALKHFLFVPGSPQDLQCSLTDLSFLKNSDLNYKLVFSAPRTQSTSEYLCVGSLTPAQTQQIMSLSSGTLLAFHDFSLLELQNFSYLSRQSKSPLLVRPQQNEDLPGLCRHNKNGWVLEQGAYSLQQLLRAHPDLSIVMSDSPAGRMELMDSTLNELQRLYQKAYQNRWA